MWNEVLIMKHLWNVADKKDTLWVKWINVEKLQGRSIWEIPHDNKGSIGWKNLLGLREKIKEHVFYKIGNEKDDGNWCWPAEWSTKFPRLNRIPMPNIQENEQDEVVWVTRNRKMVKYSTSNVWKDMCCNGNKVAWKSMVWFPQCIPRHSFVLWMVVQGKLLTEDRIAIWNPNDVMKCALCSEDWQTIVDEVSRMDANNNIWNVLRRLVIGAAVYFVWQERNDKMFKQSKRDKDTLMQLITETVKLRLMSFKVKESKAVRDVEVLWNVQMKRVISIS
ncbi:RNA-directed DNA polymerase, eukaryota, reverse transcriptase zinc-binding domain protein [Tanacetum coccineum]